MDFLRPFLFPIVVCTIVGTVWAMAWNRSMNDHLTRVAKPAPAEEVLLEAARRPAVDQPIAGLDRH